MTCSGNNLGVAREFARAGFAVYYCIVATVNGTCGINVVFFNCVCGCVTECRIEEIITNCTYLVCFARSVGTGGMSSCELLTCTALTCTLIPVVG